MTVIQETGVTTVESNLTDPGVGHVIPASEVGVSVAGIALDPKDYVNGTGEVVVPPSFVQPTVLHRGPLPEPGSGFPVGRVVMPAEQPVQLQSKSNEHYTPTDIVERARWLMHEIHLDPASCPNAQTVVRATRYITNGNDPAPQGDGRIAGDGLALRPWHGNVFLNPPGGAFKVLNKNFSNAALWWAALSQEWLDGTVKQAVFIGFTLEILRHSQNGCPIPVQAFHRCYPRKRIKFGGKPQPTHANVIVYLAPKVQDQSVVLHHYSRFASAFGALGICEMGINTEVGQPVL